MLATFKMISDVRLATQKSMLRSRATSLSARFTLQIQASEDITYIELSVQVCTIGSPEGAASNRSQRHARLMK